MNSKDHDKLWWSTFFTGIIVVGILFVLSLLVTGILGFTYEGLFG